MKERWKNPEYRAKFSLTNKGKKKKPFTDEHRKNISISKKGYKPSKETRKKMIKIININGEK